MSVEYKQKESVIDLYNILGLTVDVCNKPNCNELIREAYLKKAKICHPDKNRNRPEVLKLFDLVHGSFEILCDEKQRTNYNHKLKLDKQSSSSYIKLKKSAADYSESGYLDATDDQKISFDEKMKLQDKKYGYDVETEIPIPKADAQKKLQSYMTGRATQDVDYKPENIFEGGKFSHGKFNRAFDEQKKQLESDNSTIIAHGGIPSAWNDQGKVANFSNFDDLDNLFVEDSGRIDLSTQSYGSVDIGYVPSAKLTKDFVSGLDDADYYQGHSHIDDDYYADMKQKLSQRGSEQKSFENMEYNDYKKDDTAGYGIFEQLGLKYEDRLALDMDNDDIAARFEKLMKERQKEIPAKSKSKRQ